MMLGDARFRRLTCAAGLSIWLWLGFALAVFHDAHAETFIEDFTTRTFCDTSQTTAWWDTVTGELKLHPFVPELVGGIELTGEVCDIVLAGDFAYLAVEGGGFQVVDISDPEEPVHAGGIQNIEFPFGLAVDGDHAYLAAIDRLLVVDISAPSQPVVVAQLDGLSEAAGIVVAGDFAYVASGNAGLLAVDISAPAKPSVVGSVDTPGHASSVTLYGDHAYVTDGYLGIAVIDISDPRVPVHLHQVPASYHPERICVAGQLAFVAEISSELLVYSLLDPTAPVLIGACSMPGHAQDVDVDGVYAYVTVADDDHTGFYAVDVSDPTAPRIIEGLTPPGFPIGVIARGEYAFVNCFNDDLQVVRIADAVVPAEADNLQGIGTVLDLAADGEVAYLLTRSTVDHFFRTASLADPTQLAITGTVPLVHHGLNFVLHGPNAFVTAGEHGLITLDVHDLANPTVVAELDIDGTTIYIEHAGNYVYLGVLGTMDCYMIVIDVTDPGNPVQVAELVLSSTPHGFARSGNYLFVTEHEDGGDRYVTEIAVIDISDPRNPFTAASYYMDSVFADALRVEGNVLYVSFWSPLLRSVCGFELLDISDPLSIQPLGVYWGDDGFGSEVCLAGDIAYVAGGTFRIDVLDVSSSGAPLVLHSVPTSFASRGVDRAGDFLFCGAAYSGLHSMQVFDRLVNKTANAAQSLPLPTSGADLSRIRLDAIEQPVCAWEISADGGVHWQRIVANGSWRYLDHPGPELLWRAALFYSGPGSSPGVDRLELEWTYASTAVPETTPACLALHQNVPNPFNPVTTIRFELSAASIVTLEILDVSGRLVTILVEGEAVAGSHDVEWDGLDAAGRPVSSGIYLYRLTTPSFRQTRKMLLLQ